MKQSLLKKQKTKRIADIVVDTLADLGLDTAFSVVGGGSMYLNNAFGINRRIRTIYCHHEQACAMAAEGYAKYNNGKPAIVQVTTGPGGTNTITGVVGAYLDSIPMIIISGQCRYNSSALSTGLNLRSRGVQEFNIIDTVKTMTKYSKLILDPKDIIVEIRKAYEIAISGRPGPVWLDIPQNIQNYNIDESQLNKYSNVNTSVDYDPNGLNYVYECLKNAKRPCILAGGGIRYSGNYKNFINFLKNIKIPVVNAGAHPDVLYRDHKLCIGTEGQRGQRCANFTIQIADVVLVIGASLSFSETGWTPKTFAPNAKILMVNIDDQEWQKPDLHINYFLKQDLKQFFRFFKNIKLSCPVEWMKHVSMLKNRFDIFEGKTSKMDERVNTYNFWETYSKIISNDAITCLGNSSCISGWLQCGSLKKNQRSFVNTNYGSMGHDLPESIGVAIASGKPVNLITGDGSIMMNLQELQTISYNKLPIRIIIFSNYGYNSLKNTFFNYFNGVNAGCGIDSGISMPVFRKIANAFGFKYVHCRKNKNIEQSLEKTLSYDEPVIMEVDESFEHPSSPCIKAMLKPDGTSEEVGLEHMYPYISQNEFNECININ